ncbi:ATP-binding cassette domain-containing protein [Dielma fastidiosa]|uniref:UvrABC system protein A n=1 Tax=Dielma fastidiosa TaxID=1034346 RepID=A0A318KFW0_9FIRM|nr:excinuclease ABC subunit UvrA [Dielma fastidiosa]PXX76180.1 excinuclease ABC subunit A [Dielma fastidiosa]
MSAIIIKGARTGNLKNIDATIPKQQLVVLTGVSGCGKSTLAIDTLFQECQRRYLEAMGMQGIQKPKLDSLSGGSPAILITAGHSVNNPRSSLGTMSNIYTDLRMLYEKLSARRCPICHELFDQSMIKEETEKQEDSFKVYIHCPHCHARIEKLTRSHFSYNTREGACTACQGLGQELMLNESKLIDETLSLKAGAVAYWEARYKEYQIDLYEKALKVYGLPAVHDLPVKDFSEAQKSLLLDGTDNPWIRIAYPHIKAPKTVSEGLFEGVRPILWRRLSEKGSLSKQLAPYFIEGECRECHGERLNMLSREASIMHTRLPELVQYSLEALWQWIDCLEKQCSQEQLVLVEVYLLDLKTKLQRLINAGLSYLTLDRQTMTLSGGELQRIRLAAALDSELSGVLYILDEPTTGLHAKDTEGIIQLMNKLKAMGNTVLVIEHDPDVMKAADQIIDMGPGAGRFGGEIVAQGSFEELQKQASSITGQYFKKQRTCQGKNRQPQGWIEIINATRNNLKHLDIKLPINVLCAVTGVSGSGKSTLIFEVLAKQQACDAILNLQQFKKIIAIEQTPLNRMKRSNVATYSTLFTEIRKIYAKQGYAAGLTPRHFSFNAPGGRCEHCQGLGTVTSNLLFFNDIEVTCPICHGRQFSDDVLKIKFKGYNIHEILHLSIMEAAIVFQEFPKLMKILTLLIDSGLGYLELAQSCTTLSAGEAQRLKLANELNQSQKQGNLYLIDEPTTGLHPLDIDNFLKLLQRLVDQGNTVIVVEHNLQLIRQADYIIDLGPLGGIHGGKVIAQGTPLEISENPESITGHYLKEI